MDVVVLPRVIVLTAGHVALAESTVGTDREIVAAVVPAEIGSVERAKEADRDRVIDGAAIATVAIDMTHQTVDVQIVFLVSPTETNRNSIVSSRG